MTERTVGEKKNSQTKPIRDQWGGYAGIKDCYYIQQVNWTVGKLATSAVVTRMSPRAGIDGSAQTDAVLS